MKINVEQRFSKEADILWNDKKRWCGKPWTFTNYYIIKKGDEWSKFFSSIGFISSVENEVNLYRIYDISVYRSISNRIFGVGNITLYCNDDTNPQFTIHRVKNPYKVRDLLADLIEDERRKRKVGIAEIHR